MARRSRRKMKFQCATLNDRSLVSRSSFRLRSASVSSASPWHDSIALPKETLQGETVPCVA